MKWKTKTFQALEPDQLFSAKIVQSLKEIHIDTLEDLYALFRIESMKDHFVSFFKEDQDVFQSVQAKATQEIHSDIIKWFDSAVSFTPEQMTFGCNEPTDAMIQESEQIMGPETDLDFMISELEASHVSHIHDLPPVRFQGDRGTCVAFGSVAVREFFDKKQDRLSEQYLYWGAKMRDGKPGDSGTWIRFAMDCLKEEGVCLDREWHYNPEIERSEHQGTPPDQAIKAAKAHRISEIIPINPKSVNDLRSVLLGNSRQKGRIISFSVPVFDSWYKNPITSLTGRFPMPLPGEVHRGGHCMCLVGFKDDPEWPGGGFFILRNSWSEQWAKDNLYGAGYGVLPYKFMALYGWEAWTMGSAPKSAPKKSESKDEVDEQTQNSPIDFPPAGSRGLRPGSKKYGRPLGQITISILILTGILFWTALFLKMDVVATIYENQLLTPVQLQENLIERGNRAMATGRMEASIDSFSKAISLDPESEATLTLKAVALYKKGDLDQAIILLSEALAVSEDKAGIYYQMGLIYQEKRQTRKALLSWYAAIDLEPDFTSARYLIKQFAQ